MTFDDLTFERDKGGLGLMRARVMFSNGYGASVVTGFDADSDDEGLYELAVLDATTGQLNYRTPITDDVIGHLTPADVTDLLHRVEALPAANVEPAKA